MIKRRQSIRVDEIKNSLNNSFLDKSIANNSSFQKGVLIPKLYVINVMNINEIIKIMNFKIVLDMPILK